MNWRLILSGTQSFAWTLAVFAAIVLAVALFAVLRKYEARLVSPAVGRTLLCLRILVLFLLLITLLQPVLTKTWDEDRRARLVIGFDVSESMETADRHAAPAEMLRWAQALGMLGNDATAGLLDEWISAYDSGQQPDWGNGDADLGNIRHRHVEGVFSELGAMSRTEFVRRLLLSKPNDLLPKLKEQLETDLQVFGTDQQRVAGEQLQELLDSDRKELRPGGTDAIGLLANSIAQQDGRQVQGIVLFTDGRQTVTADTATEAARLKSMGVPVYCVPIGSALSPRDLSIASVQVPQSVFLNDNAQVQATIAASGFAGDDVTVSLLKDGDAVDQKTVTVAADSFDVEFAIPTEQAGNHEYTIATDIRRGEIREDNNSRDFTMAVVDSKAKVLLVEGDARWEFRYLMSALERDKRIELSTILFRQPFLQLLNRPFLDNQLPEAVELKQKLSDTDMLIVGDVNPTDLPETFWQAVEQAVADESLTLMVLPGRRFMPHSYQSATLQRLLPVSDAKQQLAERIRRTLPDELPTEFRLQPTAQASDLTLFDFSDPNSNENQTTLATLPGHPWAYVGIPKPVASVWAAVDIEGMNLDARDMATVVHQYYGFGQVVWSGIDSTWRWRRRAGDRWHHQFWGQVVRWAARNKSAAGNDQVRMTLSDVIIDESEGVDISVRWNPNVAAQLQDALIEVTVESLDDAPASPNAEASASQRPRTLQLSPMPSTPERYHGRLAELEAGSYRVKLKVSNARFKLDESIESELVVQRRLSTELANISCNRDFLQQLATATGGRMLEPWQLQELPDLLRPDDMPANVVQEKTLWDHWSILLLFFALLMTEWVIRKLNGLP
ncbi:VWA domain-containing protein [Fuerstiella marisgermanici]|uniref:Putative membrane protein n=1 Tax=Fuerstiella marisgermanici TaxID=1891926 RepID=A0A1P8WI59_9PLAN|nr:VWA domain-containing protein [Fuerstiella marisgermanici]APZ93742.1 putative membrane protein [Fuerstiella marisgermanici]